jgi:uncharacterized protein (DUF2236 family)
MLRRVQRESVVALSGPRAVLMQATHPVAFAGFFAHTGSLKDPYGRLQRTAMVMNTIGFGRREDADRQTARVRHVHSKIRGALRSDAGRFGAGTPYRADDPELLFWIVATLVDSGLLVYQKYVRSMTDDEREHYWQDWKVIARLFGVPDDFMPDTVDDFGDYMDRMLASGDLFVSDEARELAIDIVMKPPVPLAAKPLMELVNQITIGLLPAEIRRLYGFAWDPVRGIAVHTGAEYLKRVVVPLLPERVRIAPGARSIAA